MKTAAMPKMEISNLQGEWKKLVLEMMQPTFKPSKDVTHRINEIREKLSSTVTPVDRELINDILGGETLRLLDSWLFKFFPEVCEVEPCRCGRQDCPGWRLK
jgi:hypothetical protein